MKSRQLAVSDPFLLQVLETVGSSSFIGYGDLPTQLDGFYYSIYSLHMLVHLKGLGLGN